MGTRKFSPQTMRQLASDFLEQTDADDRPDLVTSLVRQWTTYENMAALFLDDWLVYLKLTTTSLGKPFVDVDKIPLGQVKWLEGHWKIDAEQVPDLFGQLNRGQCGEVINRDGIPLRVWVNPTTKTSGIESLIQPRINRAHHKIALEVLTQYFGDTFDSEEMDQLAHSVVGQWQQYAGAACIFHDGRKLVLTFSEKGDGGCVVNSDLLPTAFEDGLCSLGVSAEEIPDVIARINLGEKIAFRNRQGVPSVLWHDPKVMQILIQSRRPPAPASPQVPPASPPFLCPKCRAVLRLWQPGERQQTCAHCHHTIVLSGL